MDEGKRELVRAWLLKASHDLDTARQISSWPEGHLDAAIYHCQQAAEKAVKGFLALHDHESERTHDLKRLIQVAVVHDPALGQWMDTAITLTPYATAYRYPGESAVLEPSRAEFDEALKCASRLVEFVFALMPSEVQPNRKNERDT